MRQAILLLLAAAMIAGCQSPVISPAAVLPADEDSAAYLDRVSSQRLVGLNDATRGIILLMDGQDQCTDFDSRVALLRSRNVLPADWKLDESQALSRGQLAYMICQACNVRGGLTMTLTGPTQRYCLRELQYQGFIGRGSVFNNISGMEYVAVLGRADKYMQTGQVPSLMAASLEGE